MRYTEFKLNEGFKEVQIKFSQEADPTEVASAFDVFKKLVSANRISGNERNIDWWSKQGWPAFIEYVTAIDERPSSSEQDSRKNKGNSYVLEETAEWLIVVPLDKDASCFHGKKSDWCTTKPTQGHFEDYFRNSSITLIYFFRQSDGAMWAMAVYPDKRVEYFDQSDKSLSSVQFDKQTGLSSKKYIQLVGGKTEVGQKATTSREVMKASLRNLQDYIRKLGRMGTPRRSAKIETMLLKVKDETSIEEYFYILHEVNGPVEADQQLQTLVANSATSAIKYLQSVSVKTVKVLERNLPPGQAMANMLHPTKEALAYITNRGLLASAYARRIIKGPWPEGEAAIAEDGLGAATYALDIINKDKERPVRWPPGEAAIATNANASIIYARDVLEKAWPPGEAAIAKDAETSLEYARKIIKGEWPPGEDVIAQDGSAASRYVIEVLNRGKNKKVRWPEAEDAIATESFASYQYARMVIGGRWKPGEAAIALDGYNAAMYATEILEREWPVAESVISQDAYGALVYARGIIEGEWPEGEAAIATLSDAAYEYATDVLDDQFLEGEAAIRADKFLWPKYKRRFDID